MELGQHLAKRTGNIHSWSTLLGTPVYPLIDAIIKPANHVAAVQCIKSRRYRLQIQLQLMFTSTIRMARECDLSYFDCGMIVGARRAGMSISVTAKRYSLQRMV